MDPKWLNRSRVDMAPWAAYRAKYAPQAQLWLGETGPAYHSGQNLTTNRFEDGFWFVNQLGVGALLEYSVQCRQVLVGGNYGLIDVAVDRSSAFVPNPDYWTYLFYKRVVGTRALVVTATAAQQQQQQQGDPAIPDDLIAYAYCARRFSATGGVALTFGNLNSKENYTVTLELPLLSNSNERASAVVPRIEYHLSAPGGLHSSLVYLNADRPLLLSNKGLLPDLSGQTVTDPKQPIVVKPHTLVFVEFPNAQMTNLCP
eukprot:TRINITY_DN2153_c3_g1_i1.p1 TRINITY_DN2153_c3_g1~~TRINITY_DN2153_c3_g1_i1.p1  ORF type:complete len:258 (-),score=35.74 TRINITY_DN2153_c3_g1_i1:56-829(-)